MPFSSNVFSVKFSGLCRKRELSPRKALKEIFGMDGSNLPKWKNGESIPKADLIYAVAEYFEVSADYLLGRETPAKLSAVDNFSSDEYQIVMSLRMASRRTRGIALASMNAIIQAAGEQGEQIAAEKRSHADGSDDDQL